MTILACPGTSVVKGVLPANTTKDAAELPAGRYQFLDGVRGVATGLIVAHHLTFYGRASDVLMEAAPGTMTFLYDHARLVVQVFLVLSGFCLARSCTDDSFPWRRALQSIAKRYVRLAAPYFVTLALVLGLAFAHGDQESAFPLVEDISAVQVTAHFLFLHKLLGYDSLSAGAWYLCIEMQLAVLFYGSYALASAIHRWGLSSKSAPCLSCGFLVVIGVASAFFWNRNPAWEDSVIYFFASSLLGILIAWDDRRKIPAWVLPIFVLMVVSSNWLELRPRLLLALCFAGVLWMFLRRRAVHSGELPIPRLLVRSVIWFGTVSYSLFLIHYPVMWLVMTALDGWMANEPARAWAVMLLAFAASAGAAAILYRLVEKPMQGWLGSQSATSRPRPALGSNAQAGRLGWQSTRRA